MLDNVAERLSGRDGRAASAAALGRPGSDASYRYAAGPSASFDVSAATIPCVQDQLRANSLFGPWRTLPVSSDDVSTCQMWNLRKLVICTLEGSGTTLSRNARDVQVDRIDHYLLSMAIGGSAWQHVHVGDARVTFGADAPMLLDLAETIELQLDAGQHLQVYFPRAMLDELLPDPVALHATRLGGAAGRVVADHLLSLCARLPALSASEACGVATATLHLIAAGLCMASMTPHKPSSSSHTALSRMARRYIEVHLHEPDLEISAICKALRVSRATLYRVFEPVGGVAKYIRERRLERTHRAICAPRRRSMSLIAEDHGFSNPSQFSRAFHKHFGYLPRDVAAARARPSPAPTRPARSVPGFSSWLHGLGGCAA